MNFISAGARHHGHLGTAVATRFRSVIPGLHANFSQHIGVDAKRCGLRSALAGIIDVNPIQRVVPGTIPCAMHMASAASVGTTYYAGLHEY